MPKGKVSKQSFTMELSLAMLCISLFSTRVTTGSALQMDKSLSSYPCGDDFGLLKKCTCRYPATENPPQRQQPLEMECTGLGLQSVGGLQDLYHELVSNRLSSLIFTGNNITMLPRNLISNCSHGAGATSKNTYFNLVYFDLSDNNIQVVHGQTFHCMQNLHTLILDNNNLEGHELDRNERLFSNLPALKYLSMVNVFKYSGNKTATFSKVFESSQLVFLEELRLENNYLGAINENAFRALPALKKLHLSHNLLSGADIHQWLNIPTLTYIDLRYNVITSLSQNAIDLIEHKIQEEDLSIDLSGNPFRCDCKLLPLYYWLKNTSHPSKVLSNKEYTCTELGKDAPKLIKQLEPADLEHCDPDTEFANMEDKAHAGVVVLSVIFGVIVISLLLVGFMNRKVIKEKAGAVVGPWLPRLFSRARGYSTVSNVSSAV